MRKKTKKIWKKAKKGLDKTANYRYNSNAVKKDGPVVQLVRTLACHARGRRFEPVLGRHLFCLCSSVGRAED